jgi:flagellar hook assembly protein FlgD
MSFFRTRKQHRIATIIVFMALAMSAFGYDPPKGGALLPSVFTPWSLSSAPTVTGEGLPWASFLNPSALAGMRLNQIEATYTGISDLGVGTQGWGSAASLAFTIPNDYGVWNGGARFFSSPAAMTSMPLGTWGQVRAGFSKDLFPNLYVGSALSVAMGGNGSFGWGIGLDLGATAFLGDLGFLKDTRLGFALLNIGKGYSTSTPPVGIFGSTASSWPAAFTLGLGINSHLVRTYDWNLDVGLDLWSPSFQDLEAGLSLGFGFRNYVRVQAGWSVGLRDVIASSGRSFWPSIGISGTIPLSGGVKLFGAISKDAQIDTAISLSPFYDSLWATGAGFALSFGLIDKTPPSIELTLPVKFGGIYYISPKKAEASNPDGSSAVKGQNDSLVIPVKMTDERYVAGWLFKVEDKSSGKIIRTIRQSIDKPEAFAGMDSLRAAFAYSRKGVKVPTEFVWDGKDDKGVVAPDGPYTVSVEAWDDSGNVNLDNENCMIVVVLTTKPVAEIHSLDQYNVFSPDGDGNKDTISFRDTGSVQNSWKIEVLDGAGKAVRTILYSDRSAPRDFTWDGTADNGQRVPDGAYSVRLSTQDEAGNYTEKSVTGIVVDTFRPAVGISLSANIMSPNNDGIKDTITLLPNIESMKGLISWEIYVLNPERKRVWLASGAADSPPASSYVFNGLNPDGSKMPDGQYEAGISLVYQNGYQPQKLSGPFVIDTVPPSATISLDDPNTVFSPDGDGSRDSYPFSFTSSDEITWNMVIRDKNKNEKVVKQFSHFLPEHFAWDGKDDQGRVVPDGQYEVYVYSVDAAGNSFSTTSGLVTVDTRRPTAALTIDRDAFSPNGDGIKDTVTFSLEIASKDGMNQWKISVTKLGTKEEVWSQSGTDPALLLNAFTFDGKDSAGKVLPEGEYQASLELGYINGYSTKVESPKFALDVTFPGAKISLDKTWFNPLGNASQSTLAINQTSSVEELWTAEVRNGEGKAVKTWTIMNAALSPITWDGRNDSGSPVPDGSYSYVAYSTDRAGNAFVSTQFPIGIDTQKKQISLNADTLAFSPNGDNVKDTLTITARATASETSTDWNVWISSAASGAQDNVNNAVVLWKGKGALPDHFTWNGKADSGIDVPDGRYMLYMSIGYPNGDKSQTKLGPVLVDRIAPQATVKASVDLFSPNGDGILDTVEFIQTSVPGDDWTGTIVSAKGDKIRSWTWTNQVANLVWDGKDDTGYVVPDGDYFYSLSSSDAAGNSFTTPRVKVRVETQKKEVRLEIDQRAFSPNGDGIRDTLTLTPIIQAPERVKSYELSIIAQEGPLAMSVVKSWKGSAPVMPKYVWSGDTDAGGAAPDGRYAANLTVHYTNGDIVESATSVFLVDRIFPKIEVSISGNMISPNGDGRSDTIEIRQKSVPGDDWAGRLRAADGTVVRTWTWKNEAKSFVWDGTDGTGAIVRDGNYTYQVESEDSAGNKTVSAVLPITVDTSRQTVRIDRNYDAFSPNGDGVKDMLRIGVYAQSPEKVVEYVLSILSAGAANGGTAQAVQAVRTWKGSNDIRSEYSWDGTSDAGIPAPEGTYLAHLMVRYSNDDLFNLDTAPFVVDRIAPKATVRASLDIFSPNGDGRADTVQFIQESVPGDNWTGTITSESGRLVRTWSWENAVTTLTWDGKDQVGNLVPDGAYYYELTSTDAAGNSFTTPKIKVVVDATKKLVALSVEPLAFSPNGDGIKDQVYLNIQAPKRETLINFDLSIYTTDASGTTKGAVVKSWKGTTELLDQYIWDGKADTGFLVPDGYYVAELKLRYDNADSFDLSSKPILLDTVAPKIEISADPLLFSPNGDGIKDTMTIIQKSVPGDDWVGRIKNSAGTTVRTWTWKNEAKSFVWDGKDFGGNIVSDGAYSYEVSSTDAAGNSAKAVITGITVDASKPKVYVTASDTGISPNGDGIRDTVSFALIVSKRDGIESWRFSLLDKQGQERAFFGGTGSDVPARLVWDGRDLQGQVIQGEFVGKLVVKYSKGDIAQATSKPVVVDINPPNVSIVVTPEYFSPDGDGVNDVLTFGIKVAPESMVSDWRLEVYETAVVESSAPQTDKPQRLFRDWSGKGNPPEQIKWDGTSSTGELVQSATDYPFKFVAHDALGNSTTVTGTITVDVLVMRDGDKLKIKVPSIVFRANYADFVGLDPEIVARNQKVVARVAQILNKFPDYSIQIEGHGNNVGKMLGYSQAKIQAEETNELIPLSTARADVVKNMLVQNGVDARRMSVIGLGSSEPVVAFTDVVNRWKNRRVEFVLIKAP